MASLEVSIKITPHPEKIESIKLDALLNGELAEFEKYFLHRQQQNGQVNPSPLILGERSIIKAYIIYAASKEEA